MPHFLGGVQKRVAWKSREEVWLSEIASLLRARGVCTPLLVEQMAAICFLLRAS